MAGGQGVSNNLCCNTQGPSLVSVGYSKSTSSTIGEWYPVSGGISEIGPSVQS